MSQEYFYMSATNKKDVFFKNDIYSGIKKIKYVQINLTKVCKCST